MYVRVRMCMHVKLYKKQRTKIEYILEVNLNVIQEMRKRGNIVRKGSINYLNGEENRMHIL